MNEVEPDGSQTAARENPRILLDAYWWSKGPASGRMIVRELLTTWGERYPNDDVHLAVRAEDQAEVAAATSFSVHVVRARPHALAAASMGYLARRIGADCIYSQNFAAISRRPTATFVHDVLFMTNPEWFTPVERAYLAPIPVLARRADLVLTSSESEAARIRSTAGVTAVTPVGLGVAAALTESAGVAPAGPVPERFALSVGRLNVRKNLERLLMAAAKSPAVSVDTPMLVVGEPEGRTADLPQLVREATDLGSIRFLGYVTDAELRWLYERAQVLAFVSLDEGFGLPPIEAASFGCPVIASDIAVFRETLVDANVTFVEPLDVPAMERALGNAMAEPRKPDATFRRPEWSAVVDDTREALRRIAR